ncbi:MAG TPA: hypothetical protein OIM48_04485 [Clostridiaceae bacterium]|nr:hypothetical protein [Clostridiaceae bacterium]
MDKCKECSADASICEYCIYNEKDAEKYVEDTTNDNIIYYNNEKYDNVSKKVCPMCKKVYTGYPATSRKDNKTLICSECGMKEVQEPFESILNELGIEIIDY